MTESRFFILLAFAIVLTVGTAAGVVPRSPDGTTVTSSLVGPVSAAAGVHVSEELKAKYRRPETIPAPPSNPLTPEKAELGKTLFFDPRLSRTGSVSCASCHQPGFDWGDGLKRGVGVTGVPLPRKTPTVLNAAWLSALMWDGRAGTLEQQAVLPITAEHEMGLELEEAVARVKAIEGYAPLFEAAYPGEGVRAETVLGALASFQRTLVSGEAPFDKWIDGDEAAISEAAKRGFLVFNEAGRCAKCHSSWRLTDDSFHDIGLESDDIGRGQFAPPSVVIMQHAFKTPTLRDFRLSGPYMHDGSMASLDEVIDHYEDGGKKRPSLSPEMQAVTLSAQERADLIAYLKTLQGPPLDVKMPRLP
ncbi:tryptophan tryptophylquinone biosynthesis enzyme MauG [Hyphomicrobium sp.]|uniref:tryptophan tryptophylquinone biosynthesis enzyme MauG n=1 Tax=Hyphomicrobium sp. TaxID=82 RepID=UPI002C0A81ED|nr:tryptophan tryptophylquinone biosynthesis enzyme MauG [Hyphomicrobium sp.]HRN87665.1 tryptophan tryptophylquinone biosynthesis enzyme MauG [Hyphomicrobium sp.]HRQ27903.1 tryptophan tryptophylquinone biosynthesis enzyme MauG [Hyphomicrobium sp.]